MKRFIFFLLILSPLTFAKDHQWQTAHVLSMESGSNGAAAMPVGGMIVAVPLRWTYYRVETQSMTYVIGARKAPLMPVNGQVQLAIEGTNAFVRLSNGKAAKLRIMQMVAH